MVDFPHLRLKLIEKEKFPYWAYSTDEEIQYENLVKIVDLPLNDEVPEPFPLDITPLCRVHFSQIEEKTKIKVIASHCLVDGKNIFGLLELFSSYVLNKELTE